MSEPKNKFEASRRVSGLTLDRAAELAELSKPAYIKREVDPTWFRLSELQGVYDALTDVGKSLMIEAINEIFLPEMLHQKQQNHGT